MKMNIKSSVLLLLMASISLHTNAELLNISSDKMGDGTFFDLKNAYPDAEGYRLFMKPKHDDLYFKGMPIALYSIPYFEQNVGCCIRDENDLFLDNSKDLSVKELMDYASTNDCYIAKYDGDKFPSQIKSIGIDVSKTYLRLSCPVVNPNGTIPTIQAVKEINQPTQKQEIWDEGMYKIGIDIPAGEYKAIVKKNEHGIGGFLRVWKDSSHRPESIIAGDSFQSNTYFTVNDGVYFEVFNSTITLVKKH